MRKVRAYEDPCGIARALDRLGERWALLVVRELIYGPRRFSDLRAGLAGVSPNVLSQRLEELVEDGIVERQQLAPPAGTWVYALTPRGQELEDLLLALGRWGSRAPLTERSGELSAAALFLALRTTYVPIQGALEVGLVIGLEHYRVRLDPEQVRIARAPAKHAAATLTTDVPTLRRLCFGDITLEDAPVTIAGRTKAIAQFVASFRRPKIVG